MISMRIGILYIKAAKGYITLNNWIMKRQHFLIFYILFSLYICFFDICERVKLGLLQIRTYKNGQKLLKTAVCYDQLDQLDQGRNYL